ncbi:MAG: hypothetical protein KA155_10540 [Alphaproteobacteria bacterium]|jgi:hypothetical protein|nr:hypothetical protein [Alphaproteobacteria bacterium]
MLSYKQKQDIIERLADKSQWENRLDPDWLKYAGRRDSQIFRNNVIYTPLTHRHVILRDMGTKALLELEFYDDRVRIRDEHDKDIFFDTDKKNFEDPENLGVTLKAYRFKDFEDIRKQTTNLDLGDITIAFLDSGAKRIFFHKPGYIADFAAAPESLRKKNELLRIFQLHHAISFPNVQKDALDINTIKLVIARDFAVEPELRALNTLLHASLNSSYYSDDCEFVEEPWSDTTEFTGFEVAVPFNYRVETTKDGVDVYMDGERRDWLMANAQLAQRAFTMAAAPWKAERNLRPEDILEGIQNGEYVTANNGSRWRMSVYQTEYAQVMAHNARRFLGKHMHMQGSDYLALSHAEDLFMLGVNVERLHAASAAQEISKRVADKVTMLNILQPRRTDETPSQLHLYLER